MSRSYKHTPRAGDKKSKIAKRLANRRIRNYPIDSPFFNHKSYKKIFCSYDICDYQSVGTTFADYWKMCKKRWYDWEYKYKPFPTVEQAKKEYYKFYLKK